MKRKHIKAFIVIVSIAAFLFAAYTVARRELNEWGNRMIQQGVLQVFSLAQEHGDVTLEYTDDRGNQREITLQIDLGIDTSDYVEQPEP